MTDWILIAITAVYVVATFLICYFNAQAVKATKAQTQELINQYQQTNRPFITIYFETVRTGLMCFVIENIGTQPAFDVNIILNDNFIDNISDAKIKEAMIRLSSSNLYIGIRQKMFVLIGSETEFKKISTNKAIFELIYCSNRYKDHIEIDLSEYGYMLIYKSPIDDISNHLKKIQEEQKKHNNFNQEHITKHSYNLLNIISHTASEDDSLKFKIYKIVCVKHLVTLKEIAEEHKLDQETVHRLLVELCYVDNLVGTYINQDPAELNEDAVWFKK